MPVKPFAIAIFALSAAVTGCSKHTESQQADAPVQHDTDAHDEHQHEGLTQAQVHEIIAERKRGEAADFIKNVNHPTPNVYSGGQLSVGELEYLAISGVKHIINLRPHEEMNFDEASTVKTFGVTYHSIPVAGAQDITAEKASELADLLNRYKEEKIFVHCASGNRVGALAAIQNYENGANIDSAIQEGKKWGLTKLEPLVRDVLKSSETEN